MAILLVLMILLGVRLYRNAEKRAIESQAEAMRYADLFQLAMRIQADKESALAIAGVFERQRDEALQGWREANGLLHAYQAQRQADNARRLADLSLCGLN